jgi:O-antigen ligase
MILVRKKSKVEKVLFYLLILLLPTQLGKHFWPPFAFVSGIRVDYLSPTFYLTDALVVLLFSVWLIGRVNQRGKGFRASGFKIGYLLFLAYLVLNIFFSHHILGGYYSLIKFLEFSFVAFYMAAVIKEKKQIKKIAVFLAVGVLAESFIAFFQYVTQGSIGGLLYFLGERTFTSSTPGIANAAINGQLILRPYGTFPHPNVLAGYLVVALIIIVFSFSSRESVWKKILFLAAFFFGTIVLFLTMSRIAIVLWIVLFAARFVWLLHGRIKQMFLVGGMMGAVVSLCLFFTPLFLRFSQSSFAEDAIIQREKLLDAAAVMVQAKPLFGVGLGNFLQTLSTIQSPLSLGLYVQPVHNIFLLVASETGVIGFVFFVWFLFRTLTYALKHPLKQVFIPALFAVLILGFFDHYFLTLQQGQLLFAFVVGLCWTKFKTA